MIRVMSGVFTKAYSKTVKQDWTSSPLLIENAATVSEIWIKVKKINRLLTCFQKHFVTLQPRSKPTQDKKYGFIKCIFWKSFLSEISHLSIIWPFWETKQEHLPWNNANKILAATKASCKCSNIAEKVPKQSRETKCTRKIVRLVWIAYLAMQDVVIL